MRQKYYLQFIKIGVKDNPEAPIGRDIYYKCLHCEGLILSSVFDDVSCNCGMVSIDFCLHRLTIVDKKKFAVVRKISIKK